MAADILDALLLLAMAANVASAAYVLGALWCVVAFRHRRRASGAFHPPVTMLKPVCGVDEGLYDNLRSFCLQDYHRYQVIFGVRDPTDSAVPVVRRLIAEFPRIDISLVIDETAAGSNLKVSNLANMYGSAKHPYLVISDSDMRVDRNYLSSVIEPFGNADVGLVTCLYSGTPAGSFASLLGSMFINEQFLPSVLVRAKLGEIRFGFGATMAVRRELLERIGGFERLSEYLADDYMMGKLISELGFKVALSGYVVENIVRERGLWAMILHELRWARTIRTVQPLGQAFSFVMYGVPLAMLGALMIDVTAGRPLFGVAIVILAVILREWLHAAVIRKLGVRSSFLSGLLVPLRDLLSFLVWSASFFGRKIVWKDKAFTVGPDGLMKAAKECET